MMEYQRDGSAYISNSKDICSRYSVKVPQCPLCTSLLLHVPACFLFPGLEQQLLHPSDFVRAGSIFVAITLLNSSFVTMV